MGNGKSQEQQHLLLLNFAFKKGRVPDVRWGWVSDIRWVWVPNAMEGDLRNDLS